MNRAGVGSGTRRQRSRRSSIVAVLVAVVVAAVSPGTAISHASPVQGGGTTPGAVPQDAGARWSGQAAIDRLGGRLPAVAAQNGMSAAQLRSELLRDSTLKVDATNRLLFVDPPAPEAASTGPDGVFDPAIPTTDAFVLHSKPGASRVIYLDFDGHVLSGTAWNNSTGGTCTADPYDSDNAPATFTSTERGVIISSWKRIAEDFAPFDVDVTTEDPGYAAINRASTSDTQFGTRLVVTNSKTLCPNGLTLYASVCPNGCGGIAYVGVFDNTGSGHDTYQPALVFQNGVGSGAKNIVEAGSHEVGHNVGLSHDGTATTSYYRGQGDWAPIMGTGYYEPITQWSRGEYSGANQLQDDFVAMGSNGLPIRADDHGNTNATATTLTGPSAGAFGVIATAADVDLFTISAGTGSATFTATPAPTSPNLDLRLEVRDATGATVAADDPASAGSTTDVATGLGATISVQLPAVGTYTVSVDGVGKGDPLIDGYSDYGSVGNYRLTVSVPSTSGTAPAASIAATPSSGAAPLAVSFDGSGSTDADGDTLTYVWDLGTGGATATGATTSYTYTTPGTYTVTLRVTDPTGLSSTATKTITVTAPQRRIDVATMAIGASRANSGVSATATVTVRDSTNATVSGAVVSGRWKIGTTTAGSISATTSGTGVATFGSGNKKVAAGTVYQFCVTGLTLTNGTWDQTIYSPVTASDCVSIPAP